MDTILASCGVGLTSRFSAGRRLGRAVPEGDVVRRTAQRLDQALSGHVLTRSDFRVPQLATTDLSGRSVLATVSRGKHILTRFDDLTLHTHLKMEGSWHLYRPDSRWRRPAHQARVVLHTETWVAVGFQLGIVELVPADAEETVVGHLGPDLLGPDWSADEAVRRLREHPHEPIGSALIDQRNLAGLGTIYRSEACFLAGVHPRTSVSDVRDLAALVTRAQRVLAANVDRVDIVTTGDRRRGEQRWVYGRAGRPCRRCGTPIRSEQLESASDRARDSGAVSAVDNPDRSRVSYWCPHCQPAPAH